MKTVQEPAREIPVVRDVDVCVIGGGPAGLTAALQAAKHGADTLIIERYGFLGGMATNGLVGPILGLKEQGADNPTVAGITKEFCDNLYDLGDTDPWDECVKTGRCPFSAEAFKLISDRMCREYGVDVLLHSFMTDSVVDRGRLDAVIIENKSGRQAVKAKCFIDATGDADVAYRAGVECTLGRPADGKPMAMGSMFWVNGMEDVDQDVREMAKEIITKAINEDKVAGYHGGLGGPGSITKSGMHSVNITRYAGDATDV
ncbi:MAG: FAD-dependent oxidoreductase, partial [Armatimonadota bacterium]